MTKKTVLLTGASKGIGKAIKELLEKSGKYYLLTPSRNDLNLRKLESIEYFFNDQHIDVLINNAGINILNQIEEISQETIDSMFHVNLISPLILIQKTVPFMKKQHYGRIINISSIWGVRSKEFRTLYSATKFGLNGITKALSRELGEYNILVNSVCPGFVNTELTNKNISFSEQEEIKKNIPLKRFAEPSEIANLVEFLISDRNTYVTGQTIVIDGGFTA